MDYQDDYQSSVIAMQRNWMEGFARRQFQRRQATLTKPTLKSV